jgi:hypothetical protein
MKKKIIISSIVAVVILVLVSFTGVVGYQTTKTSTNAKASPLFKVRTNRAIGEESKDIACDYVGKGNTLLFPKRDDKAILTLKVVDRISRMDDKTFEKFITYIIDSARKDNRLNGINPDRIREVFYLLRYSDTSIPILDAAAEYKYASVTVGSPSACCHLSITFGYGIKGFLACILLLSLLPFAFIWVIINIISDLLSPNCGYMSIISAQHGCTAMN